MGAGPWMLDIPEKRRTSKRAPIAILQSWKKENIPIRMTTCPFTGKVNLYGGTNETFSIWDYSLATIRGGKIVLTNALRKPEELRYLKVSLESKEGILYIPPP